MKAQHLSKFSEEYIDFAALKWTSQVDRITSFTKLNNRGLAVL